MTKHIITPYIINSNVKIIKDEPHFNSSEFDYIQENHDPISNSIHNTYEVLEQYYNDVYKLFLNKLSVFDQSAITTEVERSKLKSLINELVHVKELLEGKE